MGFKIATWNVNSVRLRYQQIERFANLASPDVICLQEIKCTNEQFPENAFKNIGYPHIYCVGQKSLHGVAIISKYAITTLDTKNICPKNEARFQHVKIGDIELQNFYVPAGGDEPDTETNPRFKHKLDFLAALKELLSKQAQRNRKLVLVGDLNIAPHPHDVWSHKQLLNVVSHTPLETQALNDILSKGEFIDVARALIPEPEKVYTWWSYRNKDWRRSNRGRRLDHIWISQSLKTNMLSKGRSGFTIWDQTRDWERPSDHAPVTLELAL